MAKLGINIIIDKRKTLEDDSKTYSMISFVFHAILITSFVLTTLLMQRHERLKPKVYRVSIATLPSSGDKGMTNKRGGTKTITPVKKNTEPKKISQPKTETKKTPSQKKTKTETHGLNTSKKPEKKEDTSVKKSEPVELPVKNSQTPGTQAGEKVGFSSSASSSNMDLDSVNFSYTYYLSLVKTKIGSNWVRNYIGEGKVKIYFQILKNGTINRAIIEESSGNPGLDRLALRAVTNSSPLPPLPEGYEKNHLGIHFVFDYEE